MADHKRTRVDARARAVAELPAEELAARAEELARRWAIALIRERPLESIGEVPLEDLAREAPSLCAQVLRAVQSDPELASLTGPGASSGRERDPATQRLAGLCGARDAAALVEAVETLRGVLWESLLGQLPEPSPRLLADVGDRLAYVCSALAAAAVATIAPAAAVSASATELETDPGVLATHASTEVSSPAGEVLIVDEHAPSFERASVFGRSPLPVQAPMPLEEIEIRDERREEGPAAWISSIGAQLQRFERDSVPFAVLLVELVDLERLRSHEPPQELLRLAGALEQALSATLGSWSGSLTRERPGRCWLLAPETDRLGAERLAEQLMRELPTRMLERRAQLEVAIGAAACPQDGREPAALAAHADVGLYAARSAVRASRARQATPVDESA